MHLRLLGLFFINQLSYHGYMLQIVTEFCLLHLTASHAGCKYFVLAVKSMQKILADDTSVYV